MFGCYLITAGRKHAGLSPDASYEVKFQAPKRTHYGITKVFNAFLEYQGKQFLLVEPGGNYGDRLIWRGAEKLARCADLNFYAITYGAFMSMDTQAASVVYIHGGGGCMPIWSGTPVSAFRKAMTTHSGVIILGPQTVWDGDGYCESIFEGIDCLAERIILFARETVSYNVIRMKAPSWVEVIHDHDTALNLTLSDFETSGVRHMRLIALRRDKEAPPALVPPDSIDLVRSCECFEDWLSLHTAAEEIVTNRLYSAIVGVILGHSVTLLPNSYFKNRAVWEDSLAQKGGAMARALVTRMMIRVVVTFWNAREKGSRQRQRKGVTPAPEKRGHASAREKGSRQRQRKGVRT